MRGSTVFRTALPDVRRRGVVFRQSARDDLRAIYDYVRQRSGLGEVAKAYLRRILDRCQKIGDAPSAGVSREDLGHGVRMTVFERRLVILYRVENDTVWITNIFFGGRDYQKLLARHHALPDDPA